MIFIIGSMVYHVPVIKADVVLENAQADKARLESELANLEQEIAAKQKELEGQKGKSVSIDRDISILKTQILKSKLNIKAKNLLIQKLGGEINTKNKKIEALSTKIDSEKESLAQLIRKEREIDDKSIISLILSQDSISDAYSDIDTFASIKQSIKNSVDEIRGVRVLTESEKKNLENKKNQEIDTKVELENAKAQVELNEVQKQQLLSISKNKELEYSKVLAEKAKRKSEILAALFSLRDTSAIPFSKALEFANFASKQTGIRPAFLLSILTQESNLGANQGSCYVTNMDTGAGVSSKGKIFSNVMKPTRDIKPFIEITSMVGRDPYKTLISCPFGSSGYGGAMGPSQFIPSTWQLLKNRIAQALGVKAADPWSPKDAFMASSIYLTDLGAGNNSYTNERNAACKYYSGRSCDSKKPANSFYGDQVMARAKNIQNNIDLLQD
ncbi:MAG: lytic murein transglycosylase [Candidatus Nomurabacteria bacterium]|nr:lytic murein transglycosylase [Candidatus Nomurabacteria bacterium]